MREQGSGPLRRCLLRVGQVAEAGWVKYHPRRRSDPIRSAMTAHLYIVHFPISLAVVAAVLDIAGISLDDNRLRTLGWAFLLAAAATVFLAFATGEGARLMALSAPTVSEMDIDYHAQWGSAGIWGVIGVALLRTLWRRRTEGLFSWINLGLLLAGTALVIAITTTGMLVRHG